MNGATRRSGRRRAHRAFVVAAFLLIVSLGMTALGCGSEDSETDIDSALRDEASRICEEHSPEIERTIKRANDVRQRLLESTPPIGQSLRLRISAVDEKLATELTLLRGELAQLDSSSSSEADWSSFLESLEGLATALTEGAMMFEVGSGAYDSIADAHYQEVAQLAATSTNLASKLGLTACQWGAQQETGSAV